MRVTLLVLTLVLCSTTVEAGFIPVGLNPGDSYRLVFVTSGGRNAISTNINDYNSFVSEQANLAGAITSDIATEWKAIASTETIDALQNTNTDPSITGAPIFNLNGGLIASTNADLWDGMIDAAIEYDQFGTSIFKPVWTGTNPGGTSFSPLGTSFPLVGVSDSNVPTFWSSFSGAPATNNNGLYAISGTLSVPGATVPEPDSLSLAVICLVATVSVYWRRWRILSH